MRAFRTRFAAASATFMLATACTDHPNPNVSTDLLPPPSGTVAFAVLTTGSDVPPGYTAWVDASQSQRVGADGLARFTGLAGGDHVGALYAVASNCSVQANNPRWVLVTTDVLSNTTGSTTFNVTCSSVGSVTVHTSTTGVDLPSGYTVTLDGSTSQAIATHGTVTFTGVPSGSHSASLSDVAGNCAPGGSNTGTVVVTAGGTASLSFSVTCSPIGTGTGALIVTTSTTGSNLPPGGYMVTIDGSVSQPIAVNGKDRFTGPAGYHPVALGGMPANCAVSGANPRTVAVPAGGESATTFSVTCGAEPTPEVTGQGQLGMGSTTTGNRVQAFQFDVRADLTGTFFFIDYSDIEPDGNPATLTTNALTDPATSITAYRNASKVCGDQSRGVEFDAVGRERYGALQSYTILVCDNGPAGSGSDFLSLFLPGEGYGASGGVTSGDLAKQ